MNETFNIPLLSKESICRKLRCIDQVLSNLGIIDKPFASFNSSPVPSVQPDLCNSELVDILMETRDCLLTQLDALNESEKSKELPHESLKYTYQIESRRNEIGRRT